MFSHEEEEARSSLNQGESEQVLSSWGTEPILDKRYALLHTLGEGRYAEVRLAIDMRNHGRRVAIKLIKPEQTNTTSKLNITRQQVLLLSECQECIGILELLATSANGVIRAPGGHQVLRRNVIYLVTRYAQFGELFHLLEAGPRFSEPYSRLIFKQIIEGVSFLHERRQICHRDLKMENLLVDKYGVVKIADFGWAARLENTEETSNPEQRSKSNEDLQIFREFQVLYPIGTQEYNPPQILRAYEEGHGIYNGEKSDVFSLGVCLFMLLHASPPFGCAHERDKYYRRFLKEDKSSFWKIYKGVQTSNEAKDLLEKLLCPASKERITLKEIYSHPWLQKGEIADLDEMRVEFQRRNLELQKISSEAMKQTIQEGAGADQPLLGTPASYCGSLPENSETEMMLQRMIEEFQDISRRLRAT